MHIVDPIKPHERVHCAYCAKPLQPQHRCRKRFYRHEMAAEPEARLAEYQTNRRIVRIARSYRKHYDGSREVSWIEVVHMPEHGEWGLWGKFCGQQCAARFGYVMHEAGHRLKARI
jgi:hypothetical protein